MQALLVSTSGMQTWYTAQAFAARGALAEYWSTSRIGPNLVSGKYRWCWPYAAAMKPFRVLMPKYYWEKALYGLLPIWTTWVRALPLPRVDVVQGITGFATEIFDRAEEIGALKVLECPNSHPTQYYGFWQRECDLWCPGAQVVVPRWMFARMNRELERADVVLCSSFFVRDTMLANGIASSKLLVNPNGVDTALFQPRQQLPSSPRFLSVGGITLRKGIQYLFRAFELVKRTCPDAELICVGRYKYDFALERKRWEGKFTHLQNLPQTELAKLMQACTAFVLPSAEEGLARVVVEALAAGLPVIASYESGATTIIEDGREGFIIRGRDPAHIAEAMIRLARDKDLNRTMGEAAYRKGAVKNTWQDYGDRLLAEYERKIKEQL